MIFAHFVCPLVLLWGGQALTAQFQNPPTASDPWNAGPPATPNDAEIWNFARRNTGGFVQSISKDGITLHRPKIEVHHWRHDPINGKSLGMHMIETLAAWPAKKFLLVEELAKGNYIKGTPPGDTYRITDVRVGDWVGIEFCRRNGIDICKTITIERRPHGRVPPAPGENPDAFRKHHERANADQDWEKKRIAYPRKYWTSYQGKDGKIYEGPYPSESFQIIPILPKAPAPHAARPAVPAKP